MLTGHWPLPLPFGLPLFWPLPLPLPCPLPGELGSPQDGGGFCWHAFFSTGLVMLLQLGLLVDGVELAAPAMVDVAKHALFLPIPAAEITDELSTPSSKPLQARRRH